MNHQDTPHAISLQSVSIRYGDNLILDNCSLQVHKGESVAILGPNGAGKTTLLEVVEGLRKPSQGDVKVLGLNPLKASHEWSSRVGIVLQSWRDHFFWTTRELVALVESAHHNVGAGSKSLTRELINTLALESFLDKKIAKLSGGERRRLDVCLALLGDPDLLVLDEPTTAFDPAVRREFHDFMNSLRGSTTLVWATHDLSEAEKNCDRIVLMSGGSIVADGSPEELRRSVEGGTLVEWREPDGTRKTHTTDDPNSFLAELASTPSVSDIKVSTTSFEDVYLRLIQDISDDRRSV